MSLASSVSDLATRIASYLKTSVLPRLLPAGGAAGQVLAKSAATDYSVSWVQGWTSANFNPASYAALNADVSFGSVSSSALIARARGAEGGALRLVKGTGTSALNGDVVFDTTGNIIRVYEQNSPYRGFYVDLTGCGTQSLLWHGNNFDPATKANKNGETFTGAITLKSSDAFINIWNSNDALTSFVGHTYGYGFAGIRNTGSTKSGNVNGNGWNSALAWGDNGKVGSVTNTTYPSAPAFRNVLDDGTGKASFSGNVTLGGNASTIGSHRVTGAGGQFSLQDRNTAYAQDAVIYHQDQRIRFWWGADQFSIDSIGWARGGAYGFNNGKALIYADANLHNIVAKTGDDNAQKFFVFGADGAFSTLNGVLRSASDVFAGGRVIVGEGKTESWIEMRDSDEGTRYIHNNSSSIGFLNSSANWGLRSFNDGNIWTPWFGYLSDAFGGKLNRGRVDLIDFNGGNSWQPVVHKEGENWYMLLNSDYSVWSAIRQNGYIEFNTNAGLVGVNYWTSDADYKENIEPSQHDALSQVAAIPFVEFNYKPGAGYDSTVRQHGFLAQDIEMINPQWVDETSEGRKQPSQPKLLLSSLRSIQQLTELVARQDEELQLLRERIQRIEAAR